MELLCDQCKKKFTVSLEQERFILLSKEKGIRFIIIKCPLCSKSFDINPTLLGKYHPKEAHTVEEFRCPSKACSGFVSYIDETPPFWGCGECGNVWFSKSDLYHDIEQSIKKFPYRKKLYINKNGCYSPLPRNKEPKNYEDLVRSEWNK